MFPPAQPAPVVVYTTPPPTMPLPPLHPPVPQSYVIRQMGPGVLHAPLFSIEPQ